MPTFIAVAAAYVATALEAIGVGAETAAALGSIIVNVAVAVGLSELSSLLAPSPNLGARTQKQNIRQAIAPRRRFYGRNKKGGVYGFLAVRKGILYAVLMQESHEIDGVEEHWFDDELLTLGLSPTHPDIFGIVIDPPDDFDPTAVALPKHYIGDNGLPYVHVETNLGTDTQRAYDSLVAAFPELIDSNFRQLGIASTLLRLKSPTAEHFSSFYPSGLPNHNKVSRDAKVYDPNDPLQDPANRATFSWTRNGPRIVWDYVTHDDGMRLPLEMLTRAVDVWRGQVDLANQTRALKSGGSEPWYPLSGGYELTTPSKQVLPQMLVPMDARLYLRPDGAVVLDCGQYRPAVLTLTDNDIKSYSDFARGRAKAEIRNQITAQFVSPDYNYVEQEADPWRNTASINVDGLQVGQLDLSWATSHAEARYRMKIEAERQDPQGWVGTIVTNIRGLLYLADEPGQPRRRNVRFQIAELGLDDELEVQGFAFDVLTGRCTFSVGPGPSYGWNPVTDEGTAPPLPTSAADGIEDPSSLTVSVQNYTVSGSVVTAVLAASVPAPIQDNLHLVIQWRLHDDAVGDAQAVWTAFTASDTSWSGSTAPLAAGTYDVRARFNGPNGNDSDWIYARGFIIAFGTGPGSGAVPIADFRDPRNSQLLAVLLEDI